MVLEPGHCLYILFALPEEAAPFTRRMPDKAKFHSEEGKSLRRPHYASLDGRLCAFVCGVGMDKAADYAHYGAETFEHPIILCCGFAGGLETGLAPGSLVIADTVVHKGTKERYQADSTLLAAAESVRLPGIAMRRGTLITAQRVLVTVPEKRALARETGGLAVDMESAGAARVAQERGVPWLAVRVITDGAEDAMPFDFNTFADAKGNVNKGRIITATLTHPWKIPALLRLGARSSLAAKNLAAFLEAFVKITLLLLLALPARAQLPEKPLTLEESVAIAFRQSPQVETALLARDTAQVQADRDRPVARPTLTVSAAGTAQGPGVTFPRANASDATFLPEGYGHVDVVLEQILYHGGSRAARQRYTAQASAANWDLRRSLADMARSVEKAYLDVLKADSGVRAAQDGVASVLQYQALVENQILAGQAKPVDAETVKAQVAEARSGLTTADGGLRLARMAFNRALGRSLDAPFTLAEVPASSVPAGPEAAINGALQNRAELRGLEANLQVARADASLARTQNQPALYARAQVTEQTPTALVHEHYAAATLEVRWPVLDGGKARLDSREADLQAKRLETLLKDTREGIRLEVNQAWQKMQEAQARIGLAQTQRQGAEATATVAAKAYEVGRGTALEVAGAQREVRLARERELQADYDLQAAQVDFLYAQGVLPSTLPPSAQIPLTAHKP